VLEDTRRATRSTTVQLNQLIELGGKRGARRRRPARRRRGTGWPFLQQAETRAASSALSTCWRRRKLAPGRQRASPGRARQRHHGAPGNGRQGLPVEETRARVAEASVKLELNLARSALASARQRLAALWGNAAPRFTVAEDAWKPCRRCRPPANWRRACRTPRPCARRTARWPSGKPCWTWNSGAPRPT
jgi:cobalt-zinc-cadmium efflux system outer membrane protein